MTLRRVLAVTVAGAAALLAAGCQSQVVTMVTPPGWGNSAAEAAPETGAPTLEQVRSAPAPEVCGVPHGELVDGTLPPAQASTSIGGTATEPVASSVHLADDPATGKPLVALAADGGGAIGAAAVFQCVIDGATVRDRVVVWDADLRPLGVINLATLRGTGPVAGTSVTVDAVTARVTFQELGDGTPAAPTGARMQVPLSVEAGHLVVGAITVG